MNIFLSWGSHAEGGEADVPIRALVGIEFIPVIVPVKIGFDIGVGLQEPDESPLFNPVIFWLAVVTEPVTRIFGVFFQQVLEPIPAIDVVIAVGVAEVSGVASGGSWVTIITGVRGSTRGKFPFHPDPVG